MAYDRDFHVCGNGECEDCPNFEECCEAGMDDFDDYPYEDEEEPDFSDDYDCDEPADRILEQQEMQDFAQDGDFENMPGCGYYDDGEW